MLAPGAGSLLITLMAAIMEKVGAKKLQRGQGDREKCRCLLDIDIEQQVSRIIPQPWVPCMNIVEPTNPQGGISVKKVSID